MVQAALAAIPGLLSGQSRRSSDRPAMPQAAAVVSQGKDLKQSKFIAKQIKDDRLAYFLSQPEVIGILVTLAGIYASNNIPFTDNEVTNEGLQAIGTMSSVLIGLGYAGVGDLTTLLVAAIAAGVSLSDLLGDPFGGLGDGGIDLGWLKYFSPFNYLVSSVV